MKRLALFLGLTLLLGLTTTVAVAWFYAGMHHPITAKNRLSGWTEWRSSRINGWFVREWIGPGKCARLLRLDDGRARAQLNASSAPRWSTANQVATKPAPQVFEDERGWPFLSMRCSWHGDESFTLPNDPIRGGISIEPLDFEWLIEYPKAIQMVHPDFDFVFVDRHRALPLIPIWSGLLGSTVFYAMGWGVLIFVLGGPFAVRRFLRKRRNRCVRCAYSLQKLQSHVCPECGTNTTLRRPVISKAHLALATSLAVVTFVATAVAGAYLVLRYEWPSQLHVAAAQNDVQAIRKLISDGWDVELPMTADSNRHYENRNSTPLTWAVARGNLEAVKVLLEAGAKLDNEAGEFTTSAIEVASARGHTAIVNLLLSKSTKPVESAIATTGLSSAAAQGNPETIRALVAAGAQLESVETGGWQMTPLGIAASAGRIDNMLALLEAGAEVNPKVGSSPLMTAIKTGHDEAAALLLERGASVDKSIGPLLWEAAEKNLTETARFLLAKGADPNHGHGVAIGWTPLRRAVIRSNLAIAQMLVEAGADPQTTDQNGESILFAINWDEASTALLDYVFILEIDVNQQSGAGHTVLMQQVHRRNLKAVGRLLAEGADTSIRDNDGNTAMDYAAKPLAYSAGYVRFQGSPVNAEIVALLTQHLGAP